MFVKKQMLILANSYKVGGRCIAGREITAYGVDEYRIGSWLRPISNQREGAIQETECLYQDKKPIKVMDIATVVLRRNLADPFQPVNWALYYSPQWTDLGSIYSKPTNAHLEERPTDLWLQPEMKNDRVAHEYLSQHPPRQSLYVIRPKNCRFRVISYAWEGKVCTKRRCLFQYNNVEYDFSLTDPVICSQLEPAPNPDQPAIDLRLPFGDNLLLCVSLAREYLRFHYKIVATILEDSK